MRVAIPSGLLVVVLACKDRDPPRRAPEPTPPAQRAAAPADAAVWPLPAPRSVEPVALAEAALAGDRQVWTRDAGWSVTRRDAGTQVLISSGITTPIGGAATLHRYGEEAVLVAAADTPELARGIYRIVQGKLVLDMAARWARDKRLAVELESDDERWAEFRPHGDDVVVAFAPRNHAWEAATDEEQNRALRDMDEGRPNALLASDRENYGQLVRMRPGGAPQRAYIPVRPHDLEVLDDGTVVVVGTGTPKARFHDASVIARGPGGAWRTVLADVHLADKAVARGPWVCLARYVAANTHEQVHCFDLPGGRHVVTPRREGSEFPVELVPDPWRLVLVRFAPGSSTPAYYELPLE